MLTVQVRVQPGASRDEIAGWEDETLRVRLRARAVEGKATKSLLEFLARELKLRPYQVNLLRGERTREKLVTIDLPSLEELNDRIKK